MASDEKAQSLAAFIKSARPDRANTFVRQGGASKIVETLGGPKQKRGNKGADDQTQLKAVLKLGNVTRNRRAARKIAKNKDTIKTLLGSIKTRPRFSKLVEYSVECLTNLAVDEVSIEEMIDEGALEVLVNTMKQNPYNESIARAVNSCIGKFALNDYLADMIMSKIGGDGLIFSLKKHVEPESVISACDALGKLMTSEENVDKLVESGAIEALAHAAKNNRDQPDVVAAAARAGAKIAAHPKHAKQLMESGLAADILQAMKDNPNDAALNKAGATLLANLAASGDADIVKQLREMGAVDVLVQALEQFPEDDTLKSLGASALQMLAGIDDVGSALKLLETGTFATKAMAMSKIAGLALVDDNVDYLVSNKGVEAIISAVVSAAGDDSEEARKIMEAGCRALGRLCTNEENIYSIMQAGGVKMAISVLKNNIKNEKVAAAAIALLGNMITRAENADYISKCGGIEATLAALKAHPDSEAVAKHAIQLLSNLAVHDSMIDGMVDKGAIAQILKVMENHIDNPELVQAAITALGRMANSKENIEKIAEAGGIASLIETLNTHADNAEIARQALHLLETCAMLPENISKLRELGAMEAILKAMEAHPDDEEIQEIAARAIALIAGEKQLEVSVGNVAELVGRLEKSPALGVPIIKSMGPAVRLLSNLAMIGDNVEYLSQHGGVSALAKSFVLASKAKPSDDRDQLLADAAQGLFRLTRSAENSEQIVKAGAFHAMVAQCLESADNEELAENVMQLAQGLSGTPSVAEIMAKDGSLDAILSMMQAFPLNEAILSAAANTLANMCVSPELATTVANAGGAEVMREALLANMDDPATTAQMLKAITSLSATPETAKLVAEQGMVPAVMDALKTHADDPAVVEEALCALQKMCSESPETAVVMGQAGVFPLILKALRDHYAEEGIIEKGMAILANAAKDPDCVGKLLDPDLGTMELVQWAGSTFDDNDQIQADCQTLMDALLGASEAPVPIVVEDKKSLDLESMSNDDMVAMLKKLRDSGLTPTELKTVLQDLAGVALEEEAAELLISNGGLADVADALLEHKDEEDLFRAASVAFQNLRGKDNNVLTLVEEPKVVEALVEMIKPHAEFVEEIDAGDLVHSLEALGVMAGKGVNIQKMMDGGAVEPLLKFLSNSDHPETLEAAAKVLAKLSNDEDAAQLLAQLADLRALIAAMRKNMHLPEFEKYAVYLLANLAINDQLKSQIGIEGGIQVIIEIMKRYPDHRPLIENCCYALGNLSFESEVNISFIVACGGVEEIIKAMDNFPTEVELLESAICTLCNLCFKNDNNKKRIVDSGGARAIVASMLDNVNAVDLLASAFRTIGNLAYYTPNIVVIIKEGGVQAIVASMTVHNKNMDIINMAIRVLANLAADVDEEHMQIMAMEGAVQAIVDVALEHPDNLDIEIAAFGCLCNFARERTNSRMIVRQGGLNAVHQAVTKLIFDEELCAKAARLLLCLTYNPQNLPNMMAGNTVELLNAVIQQHLMTKRVLASGAGTFCNLSNTKDNAVVLAQKGVLTTCLQIVTKMSDDAGVLAEAFHAMSALCRAESNATALAQPTMTALTDILKVHVRNGKFLQNACTFLSNMCVFPSAADACTKTGIVESVVHAVNAQMSDPSVLLRATRVLENMAIATNNVKDHMKGLGVIDVMNKVVASYRGRVEDVSAAAQRVIDAINTPIRTIGATSKKMERKARNARDIFGDHDRHEVKELPIEVKNQLMSGSLMTKHSKTAPPRPRHVYLTPDLKWLCWKHPKKQLEDKARMKTYMIRAVEKGRVTPQLQRKKRFGKGFNADELHAFAIFGRERTVDLEAKSEAERDSWVRAIEMLIEHIKSKKKVATEF